MFAETYLSLFILICIGLIGWGIIRLERVYQFPFFMGGIFISFLLPQMIALLKNPFPLSQQAVDMAFLMSCLCAAACWVGYQFPANRDLVNLFNLPTDPKKILHGGIFLGIVGMIANVLMLQEAQNVSGLWSGRVTIYHFFAGLTFPALAIFLISLLQRPTIPKFLFFALLMAGPIQTVLIGRREQTATLVLTFGLALYFRYRLLPPRWLAIAAIAFTLVAIPLIGEYRNAVATGDWERLQQVDALSGAFNEYVSEGEYLELRGAAALMEAIVETGQYGFGAGYWNGIVFQYVPAQFLGRGIKYNLFIEPGSRYRIASIVSYVNPNGLTITGIADSFAQFDYFGCLVFAAFAYFFKGMWTAATTKNSIIAQLFYITLLTPAMKTLTHSTVTLVTSTIFSLVFIGGLAIYAQKK